MLIPFLQLWQMMMTTYGNNIGWTAIGECVNGAIHIRQERICQDAIYIHPYNPKYAIVCVADGHGSLSCPYSDEGANVAVKLVGEFLANILDNDSDPLATLSAHREIWIPKQIETHWKDAIKALHMHKESNGSNESKENDEEQDKIIPFSYTLYGATLLALVATKSFIFALQIGDGDILMIDQSGTARQILDTAESSIGEDTESLCLDNAWKYFRTQIIPWNSSNGATMFLLSTDGYANSFADIKGFVKAGTDFHHIWQEEGLEYINSNLQSWLRKSSDKGSGDDIALALVAYD